uniref:Glutaredoxin domain-containing protein n=1 Tax=Oryza punctata TaxID=4537 RepID=A0A0E0L9K3_ORYPU
MGCKGSKNALHGGGGGVPAAERRMCASRRSVAVRSATATLAALSLDREAVSFAAGVGDGVMLVKGGGGGGGYASVTVGQEKRCRRAPPRTPTKTPLRAPEEINVWELMAGLDYDEEEDMEEEAEEVVDGHGGERQVKSAPGSPAFDPDVLVAFRKAVEELPPESPPREVTAAADDDKKGEIQKFPGVVRARIILFQKEIDAKLAKKAPPPPPPPPPESARRVVVYLTSLRGIRQTYEDCCATTAILRSYGVRVDERDLSLHAGYKDELRAALGDVAGGGGVPGPGHGRPLPQVFVDGCHLGGAEDVRRMHDSGELTNTLLKACDTAPAAVAAVGKGGRQLAPSSEQCGGCGGVRFVPCDACSGSCKVFVADDEDGGAGAFRRCPECNENGLVRCPVC